jgi:hypothetical protein
MESALEGRLQANRSRPGSVDLARGDRAKFRLGLDHGRKGVSPDDPAQPQLRYDARWYAECLALQSRFDEAFAEIGKARELDPLALIIAADYGAFLYFSNVNAIKVDPIYDPLRNEPRFQAVMKEVNLEP